MSSCTKFKKSVPARSVEYLDLVVPAGRRWRLMEAFGAATLSGDTRIEVVWDRKGPEPVVFFLTYGTAERRLGGVEILGDGVKALSVVLVNESSRASVLFGEVSCVNLHPLEGDDDPGVVASIAALHGKGGVHV